MKTFKAAAVQILLTANSTPTSSNSRRLLIFTSSTLELWSLKFIEGIMEQIIKVKNQQAAEELQLISK